MAKIDLSLPKNKRYKRGPRMGPDFATIEKISSKKESEHASTETPIIVENSAVEAPKEPILENIQEVEELVEAEKPILKTKDPENEIEMVKNKQTPSRPKRSKTSA